MYFDSNLITQFITVTMTGLATVTLLAIRQPFKSAQRNKVEIMEECAIILTMYHIFCFTDFVADPEVRHYIGYSLITCMSIHLTVYIGGLSLINAKASVRSLRIKYYKWLARKQVELNRPGKKFE